MFPLFLREKYIMEQMKTMKYPKINEISKKHRLAYVLELFISHWL